MSDSLLMLLEMIEEVLEEQNDNPHNFVQKVLKANDVEFAEPVPDKRKNGKVLPNRLTYKIKSADRQRLALAIGSQLTGAIPIYSSDGSTIIGHKTKDPSGGINFKYVLKPDRGYGNEAEKMEEVISKASGYDKAKVLPAFEGRVDSYKGAAAFPGAPLAKLETQKLPAKGLYASYGVSSGTPKTDLIGTKDKNEKYSVKKAGGSQFASAQGPESAALWHVALVNSVGQAQIDGAVDRALNEVPAMIKDDFASENFGDIKAASRKDKAEVFQQFKDQLFVKIVENLSINKDAFKKAFAIEGYSGEVKFDGGEGTANKILTWSNNAPFLTGKPITIEDYVDAYKDRISIRVSDRGGKRGGAIRGEILNRPVQNESIVIEVVDDKEQEAVEAVKQFIEKYDLTTQELDAIQVELQKSLEERVTPRTHTRLGPPLQGRLPRRLPATARRGSDENKKITADAIVLAKKLGPEVFNNAIEINKTKIAPTQKAKTAPTSDVSTEIDGEAVKDRLQENYDKFGIVKFLDSLINDKEGGEINMRLLYKAALGDDVEFVDFAPPDEETPMEET